MLASPNQRLPQAGCVNLPVVRAHLISAPCICRALERDPHAQSERLLCPPAGQQQQQPASRSPLSGDSDWDSSDSEPAAAEAPPGAAVTLGTADSQVAARAPSCGAVLANWDLLQSRRCELYSSDEDGEELPDAQEQVLQAGSQPQPHASAPPRPVLQQQPVNYQQPQHRKRSFDREAEQPAGAVGARFTTAAPTAAAAAPNATPQSPTGTGGQVAKPPCPPSTSQPAGAGGLSSEPLSLPGASSLPQGAVDDRREDSPEYDAVKAWLQVGADAPS